MLKNMGVIVTLLALSAVCAGTSMAVEFTWNNAGDGDWGYTDPEDPFYSNWLSGDNPTIDIPDADDDVTLNESNTTTVHVEAAHDALNLTVDGGTIHINNGQSLSIAQTATFAVDTLLSLGTDAILSVGDGGTIDALQAQGNATVDIGGSEMTVGTFTDGGVAATIIKSGLGDLVLASDANDLDDLTFDIQGGRLVGYHGSNPLASATLDINGGEVLLSAKLGTASPVTYDNKVLVTTNGALTAGPGSAGETAAMNVQLDHPTDDLTVADGATLTLGSSGAYSLAVADPLAGLGTVRVEQGNVTLAGGGQVGSLAMIGGVLSLEANLEVAKASMSGGTASTANESSITVTELLELGNLGLAVDPAAAVTISGPDMANESGIRTLTFSGGTHTLSSLTAPDSIVTNGDFEDNSGNGSDPAGWTEIPNSYGAWAGGTLAKPHGGDWLLHVGQSSGTGGRYQDFATVVGQQYLVRLFSCGIGSGSSEQSGSVMATATDGTDFFALPFTVPAYASQDSWTEIVGTFEAQEETTRLKLWNNAGSGINIDDVEVRAILAAGPWNLPNTELIVTATSTLVGNPASDLGMGNVSIAAGQTFTVRDAKSFSVADLSLGDGSTLETAVTVGGTLDVGASPGTATIYGTLELAASGTFHVEISENLHDKIIIDGDGSADPPVLDFGDMHGSLAVTGLKPMRYDDPVDGLQVVYGDKVLTIGEMADAPTANGFRYEFAAGVPLSYGTQPPVDGNAEPLPNQGDPLGPLVVIPTPSGDVVLPDNAGMWFGNVGDGDAGEDGVYWASDTIGIGVFQAAPGDTDGNRKVEGPDILAILRASQFGDGELKDGDGNYLCVWGTGDFDGNHKVEGPDILLLLRESLFGDGTYPDKGQAVFPAAGAGGDVKLVVTADGLVIDASDAKINGFVLTSQSGILTGDDANNLGLFQQDGDDMISGAFAMQIKGEHALGDVIGQTDVDLTGDLTLTYTLAGQPGLFTASVVVPEPGTLMLLLIGLVGLPLWRRKK